MKEKIIGIIAKVLEVPTDDIELDLGIGDLPEWDSIHHVAIIAEIESELGIKFDPDDLMEVEDVSDLIALAEEQS